MNAPLNLAAYEKARSVVTERRLVGAVLVDASSCFAEGLDEVHAGLLTDHTVREVWRVIEESRRSGEPIDLPRLGERAPLLALDMARLAEQVPSAASFRDYLGTLKELAASRALTDGAHRLLVRAVDGARLDELRAVHGDALKACDETAATGKPRMLGDLLPEVLASLATPASDVVRSGVSALDAALGGGMHPGELIVLAARPSVGKSTLALVLALDAAKRGEPVLFVSIEMRAQELALKVLARAAAMNPKALPRTDATGATVPAGLRLAAEQLAGLPLHFDDAPKASLQSAKAAIIRGAHAIGARLVVVDYLGLLPADDRRASPYERTSAASRELKALARTLGVPLLALAQLNREVERDGSRDPKLADLRDSGTIEQDADVVILLSRKEQRADGLRLDAILAKNRNGPCGRVPLLFRPELSDFVDADSVFDFPGAGS